MGGGKQFGCFGGVLATLFMGQGGGAKILYESFGRTKLAAFLGG